MFAFDDPSVRRKCERRLRAMLKPEIPSSKTPRGVQIYELGGSTAADNAETEPLAEQIISGLRSRLSAQEDQDAAYKHDKFIPTGASQLRATLTLTEAHSCA